MYRKNVTDARRRCGPPQMPDQEEQRDQRELEEDVEEHHVEAGEEPEQARLERQQEGIVQRRPVADRLPRGEDRR